MARTDYTRIKTDLQGLKALYKVKNNYDMGYVDIQCINGAMSLLHKDIVLSSIETGSKVASECYDVICKNNVYDIKKIEFYISLCEIGEKARCN